MNVDSSLQASITTAPTGTPTSTLRATSASTRAWVFQSLALIHGRNTQSGGRRRPPTSARWAARTAARVAVVQAQLDDGTRRVDRQLDQQPSSAV